MNFDLFIFIDTNVKRHIAVKLKPLVGVAVIQPDIKRLGNPHLLAALVFLPEHDFDFVKRKIRRIENFAKFVCLKVGKLFVNPAAMLVRNPVVNGTSVTCTKMVWSLPRSFLS